MLCSCTWIHTLYIIITLKLPELHEPCKLINRQFDSINYRNVMLVSCYMSVYLNDSW